MTHFSDLGFTFISKKVPPPPAVQIQMLQVLSKARSASKAKDHEQAKVAKVPRSVRELWTATGRCLSVSMEMKASPALFPGR